MKPAKLTSWFLLGALILVILTLYTLSLGYQADPQSVALEEAMSSKDMVLIAFQKETCPHCKSDEAVLGMVEKEFVGLTVVRIDAGTEPGRQLAREMGVSCVPTYCLVSSATREVVYRQVGPLNVNMLLAAMQKYSDNKK